MFATVSEYEKLPAHSLNMPLPHMFHLHHIFHAIL
jgi:hypothetical protein